MMQGKAIILGYPGSGKKHLCKALGSKQNDMHDYVISLKNKYYSADVMLELKDISKDDIEIDEYVKHPSFMVIFDPTSPDSFAQLQRIEASIFSPLKNKMDSMDDNNETTLLESILLLANNKKDPSTLTDNELLNLDLSLRYCRKLAWKYYIEFIQLPFVLPDNYEQFVKSPFQYTQVDDTHLKSIVPTSTANDNQDDQGDQGDQDDDDDDDFADDTYIDEDELRGPLRVMESLECCRWQYHTIKSDSTLNVNQNDQQDDGINGITEAETANDVGTILNNPIDSDLTITVSATGSQSIYAKPFLDKNRVRDFSNDDDDDIDYDNLDLFDIGSHASKTSLTSKIPLTKEEKSAAVMDNIMDTLSRYRDKIQSYEPHSQKRREMADMVVSNFVTMMDELGFDDEDEDEDLDDLNYADLLQELENSEM